MSKNNAINNHICSTRIGPLALCTYFCLAGLLLSLMSVGPLGHAVAAEPIAMEASTFEPDNCFNHIWQMAHDHPWYLDAEGQKIVPEITQDWLIVRFHESGAASQQMTDFYSRYSEDFYDLVEIPEAEESTAAYRLRQGLPYGLFDALLQRWRDDPQVHSIQPAWRIDQNLYAPLDKIQLEWKTATDQETRKRLLINAEALPGTVSKDPHTDIVTIDPCRRLAWKALRCSPKTCMWPRPSHLKAP